MPYRPAIRSATDGAAPVAGLRVEVRRVRSAVVSETTRDPAAEARRGLRVDDQACELLQHGLPGQRLKRMEVAMCRRLLLLLLIPLATTGCGLAGGGASVLQLDGGVTAYINPDSGDGPNTTALGGGELTVVEGGCLALRSEESVFFFGMPFGTEVAADGASIASAEGITYPVGARVTAGGGFVEDGAWVATVKSRWPPVPQACLAHVDGFFGSSEWVPS